MEEKGPIQKNCVAILYYYCTKDSDCNTTYFLVCIEWAYKCQYSAKKNLRKCDLLILKKKTMIPAHSYNVKKNFFVLVGPLTVVFVAKWETGVLLDNRN